MPHKEHEELIKELIDSFSPEALVRFLEEKDRDFRFLREKYAPVENFTDIELLAQKELEDNNRLGVWAIKTQAELSERSGKKKQFELAKNILKNDFFDAGLFAFYDETGNFRLSLVYALYKGKKVELSSYKRYTYFVEKGKRYRTFEKALTNLSFESLENIKESFSRKPLIKEFYREIQNWYAWALKDPQVFFPSGKKEEHLIRLITRLVFVWFLKEKNLVPSLIFEPESLKHIVKDFMKGTNYYNAILQNLFFATLNTPAKGRRFANNEDFLKNRQDFGVKNLYRYKELLEISEEEFIRLFERVPFINGGLFECLDEDKNYVDGFTRNEKYRARIPDYLFFSEESTQDLSDFYGERKRERVKGLINILKDYNFTTDESTPLDVEVSLDPELLGHIFENLLASYNPETQETARKLTGSYYTPIEIVDFMVESALLEYFKRKTNIDEKRLEELFTSEQMPELTEEERRQIVESIDSIKVLDPAVGSGAFPMAVLHKLVRLLEKVDPDNRLWKEKQKEKVLKSAEEIFERESKEAREELLKELNENFDQALREPDYARKLYIIQNSIYGVDIQPIAIQITKLRFFLTLLIDQKIDPSKENLGIKPLPHLETNFVSANTLIKLQRPQHSLMPREFNDLRKELLELYKRHFSVRTRQEKKRIQEKAKEIREKIKEMLQRSGWSSELARKIADFDIFDQLSEADWFDPEWMFGVEGFDIVIGNPPYVRQERLKEAKELLQQNYPNIYESTADLYVYFIVRGYELLKEGGVLSYITSNKWMRARYGRKLRKYLRENTRIELLLDFAGHRVFESATVDTSILILSKIKEKNPAIKVAVEDRELKEGSLREFVRSKVFYLSQDKLSDDVYVLEEEEVLRLKEKIEKVGKPLKDWDVRIYRGVLTGFNEAFIIDSQRREEILANCKDEEERRRTEEIIKPVLRGRDIGRYYYKWAGLWLILIPAGWTNQNRGKENPEEYVKRTIPAVYNHLLSFANMSGRGRTKGLINRDDQGDYWWELRPCDYYQEFEKEKIVWQEISNQPSFTLDKSKFYTNQTAYIMTGSNLKYVLGVLNSRISYFYLTKIAYSLAQEGNRWIKQYVEQIPIPPITKENQAIAEQIEELVSQILQIKAQDPNADTQELERQIDQLVYQLYKLTPEEIELIERKLTHN